MPFRPVPTCTSFGTDYRQTIFVDELEADTRLTSSIRIYEWPYWPLHGRLGKNLCFAFWRLHEWFRDRNLR